MLEPFSFYHRHHRNEKASNRSDPRRNDGLYVGYYEALEDGDIETIVFIKKHPTFQMKFYNIHANDGEIRKVERLTAEERGWIIDYCRYRLGIDTDLKTQDDVEMCRKK